MMLKVIPSLLSTYKAQEACDQLTKTVQQQARIEHSLVESKAYYYKRRYQYHDTLQGNKWGNTKSQYIHCNFLDNKVLRHLRKGEGTRPLDICMYTSFFCTSNKGV